MYDILIIFPKNLHKINNKFKLSFYYKKTVNKIAKKHIDAFTNRAPYSCE